MKTNTASIHARAAALVFVLLSGLAPCGAADAPVPIPFRNAVDMALQHSGVMGIAAINQWRAQKQYEELRANYIPQVTLGSGLGGSYGFPLTLEGSAPSVVSFTTVQSFLNLPLRQQIKAAKIDWQATSLDVRDKRDTVILDTTLTYAQLDQLTSKIKVLEQAQAAAEKAQFVSQQRLEEGVDSKLALTRSELTTARIRLRIADAQAQSDVLREHLAKLLGVSADSIAVDSESVPKVPELSQNDDLAAKAVTNSVAVQLADQKVAAAQFRAKGEHLASKTPVIDLASHYSYLAKFNNYDSYFLKYTANNFSGGMNMRLPLFDGVQRRKADEADADLLIAKKQADLTRNQIGEDALKLQRSLRQLAAARDVAKLEWQVSQGDFEGVKARIQTGEANTRDEQNGQLDVDDKYAAYLDSEFELSRAELQLLRLTGELEGWAMK
jgi:outer membrane protein TolC